MSSIKLYLFSLVSRLLPESSAFGWKCRMLRWVGAKVGENVRVYSSVKILGTGMLEIGSDVHIGPGVMIMASQPAKVRIGSCVDIGPGVLITNGTHEIDRVGDHIAGRGIAQDVEIGDGCWLGARATILSGVSLPRKILVAAGAVVTKSIEGEGQLVAGVPAETKKKL